MALYYLTGEQFNVLETASTMTSTSADTNYPLTNLYQSPGLNRPSRPFRFNANAADLNITADINRVGNPGFETSTLDGWTKAMTATGGSSGTGARYQDVTVRAGERFQFDGYLRSDGVGSADVQIENLHTGLFVASSGWGTAASFVTTSATSYTQQTGTFTMEGITACGGYPKVTLRLHLQTTSTGNCYWDDIQLYPAVNFVSIHGHNLGPVVTPELYSDTADFAGAGTLRKTLTIAKPSFYGFLSTDIYAPDWRLKLSGTNHAIPYVGELVLGYAETAGTRQEYGWSVAEKYPQARAETEAGEVYVSRLSDDGPRTAVLPFRYGAVSEYTSARDDIVRRSYGGEVPMVVVPYSSEGDVIHGRLGSQWDVTRENLTSVDGDLVVVESGLPVVGL
jgi:hypothetical protein